MDYLTLPDVLMVNYPWMIYYPFDDDCECPKIAKTWKDGFNYSQIHKPKQSMIIDLSLEEVEKMVNNTKFPLVIWKTKGRCNKEQAVLDLTTEEKLSYLIPKMGTTKVVSILNTHNPNVLDCEWLRSTSLFNHLNIKLAPPNTMDNGDIIQTPEDMSGFYFFALISRA
jgi:hypothetical protein